MSPQRVIKTRTVSKKYLKIYLKKLKFLTLQAVFTLKVKKLLVRYFRKLLNNKVIQTKVSGPLEKLLVRFKVTGHGGPALIVNTAYRCNSGNCILVNQKSADQKFENL